MKTSLSVLLLLFAWNVNGQSHLTFLPKVDISTDTLGSSAVADLDGDGKPDLVGTRDQGTSGYLSVYRNTAVPGVINANSFAARQDFTGVKNSVSILVADLDGDQKKDVITTTYVPPMPFYVSTFTVYANTSTLGNISFSTPVTYPALISHMAQVELADLDKDGKPDLIMAYYLGSLRAYRNISTPGTIAFDTTTYTQVNGTQTYGYRIDDFNGDSLPDFLVGYSTGFRLIKNTTAAGIMSFTLSGTYSTPISQPSILDIDNDGKKDIFIVPSSSSVSAKIYLNNSTGTSISMNPPINCSEILINSSAIFADFDRDGLQDLALGSNPINVYKNYSTLNVVSQYTYGNPKSHSIGEGVHAADIDGDTFPDIISAGKGISVIRNNYAAYTGLVGYYPLDANLGDSSGSGNHGSLGTGAPAIPTTTDRFGNPNHAYSFSSNNQAIHIASNNAKPYRAFSVSFWALPLPKIANEWNTAVSKKVDATTNSLHTYIVGTHPSSPYNNKWMFGLTGAANPGTQYELISTKTKADYEWVHIAATFDGDTMKIYINGVLDTTRVVTLPRLLMTSSSPPGYIGNGSSTGGFRGAIDEVRIYDRELSPAEIQMQASSPGSAYYNFYYTKPSGDINQLSTWGPASDGSGPSPLSFDSANVSYQVMNNPNPTLNGNLTINGAGSRLIIGDGTNSFNLAVPMGNSISCDSIFVNQNITLTVMGGLNTTKLGSGTPSTVQYFQPTPQNMAAGIYDNLVAGLSTKTLTGHTTVKNTFSMMNSIDCNGFELVLGTSTTSRGTLNRSGGNISGKFTRWFTNATTSGTTGLFPVGTVTRYAPLQLDYTSAPATGGTITTEFIPADPGNNGLPLLDFTAGNVLVNKAAVDGYWKVTSTGVTGGTFTNTVTVNNFTGVNDYTGLRMIRRNTAGNWTLQGTAGANTGSNTSVVVSRTGLTTLNGEYGIGGDQNVNPLPVTLTSFTGKVINPVTTELNWKTSSEQNADRFIVQRSADNNKWEIAGEVRANGNSQRLIAYSFQDHIAGITGDVYYRLVQVDMDGQQYMTRSIRLSLNEPDVMQKLMAYPNPSNGRVFVSGVFTQAGIYDITGSKVKEIASPGWVEMNDLPSGIYFIKTADEVIKFIRQ